jgi:hypothetical protein
MLQNCPNETSTRSDFAEKPREETKHLDPGVDPDGLGLHGRADRFEVPEAES